MHHQIETKTRSLPRQARRAKTSAPSERIPAWRPETVGLTRDELRRIVLSQLG